MDPTTHQTMELNRGADLTGFRRALRILTWSSIPPEQIIWRQHSAPGLFGSQSPPPFGAAGKPIILPRKVADLIRLVVCHIDPEKYSLLYQLVWRVLHKGDKAIMEVKGDPLVRRLETMQSSVADDIGRLKAALRFRQMDDQHGEESFAAWFEPEHYIVEEIAQGFVDRFNTLAWTILTPKGSLHWNRKELLVGPPAVRSDASGAVAFEAGWRASYERTFNPESTDIPMMRGVNRPEAQAIPHLVQTAALRIEEMIEQEAVITPAPDADGG